ncbi:MAG: hypothetical protein WCT77_08860 [Bacteroidota bacterium]
MKRLFIVVIVFLPIIFVTRLYSQELPGGIKQDVFEGGQKPKRDLAMYIAVKGNQVALLSQKGWELSFCVGILKPNGFGIGFEYAYLLSTGIAVKSSGLERTPNLSYQYAGLDIEYNRQFFDLFSISLKGLFSIGKMNIVERSDIYVPKDETGDWFFTFQPDITANFFITKSVSFGLGMGYRLASGVDYFGVGNTQMQGLIWSFNFRWLSWDK